MDKTLLKVAGIISIVVGILYCLTLVGAIVGIPVVIGGCKLKDYANMSDEEVIKSKDTIIIWSVVFLLVNQIAGILGIIFILTNNLFSLSGNGNSSNDPEKYKYENLERLKKLYDEKAISKEEYEKEKERVLNGLK